jgi:hypothetical protein
MRQSVSPRTIVALTLLAAIADAGAAGALTSGEGEGEGEIENASMNLSVGWTRSDEAVLRNDK